MKSSSFETPLTTDLVLIGGGHAHVHLIKMAGLPPLSNTLRENGIQITLISSTLLTPYSGMLPGMVAGHYDPSEIHLDLCKLCRFGNVRFIHDSAVGVTYNHGGGGWIDCLSDRPRMRYDALSIDVGSSPSLPTAASTATSQEESTSLGFTPVKPIATFAQKWTEIVNRLSQASMEEFTPTHPFCLAVVGGGAGGLELALAAQQALVSIWSEKLQSSQTDDTKEGTTSAAQTVAQKVISITLVTRGEGLMQGHNHKVQKILERILDERHIARRYNTLVLGIHIEPNGMNSLRLEATQDDDSDPIAFHECLWCTSARASYWLTTSTPFPTTDQGFVKVEDTYQVESHPGVFAVGDCCHMSSHPRPKAGVFAVRAGPIVKENLLHYLFGRDLIHHEPQSEFLGLISTGDKYAVASRGDHALEGAFLWILKDQIDRTWMEGYQKLDYGDKMGIMTISDEYTEEDDKDSSQEPWIPPILATRGPEAMSAFAAAPMRCGGCGAKVGSRTLSRVLDAIYQRRVRKASDRGEPLEIVKIDPDDAAVVPLPQTGGGAMIYTIDFFRSFLSDPYTFGKIAAVHALSDCHAMGASAQTALALAVVPYSANEDITECTLIDMLSGASDVLEQEHCTLSGGHTCEGAELALGFSVNGFIRDPSAILRKRGGRVGDLIVLTKPIGTGALFAADMRAKCKGECVEEALQSMMMSNGAASRLAMEFVTSSDQSCIHACTDVTGFGLAGHLLEMLLANDEEEGLDKVSATLDLKSIPFLKGGLEASADGIYSSLQKENSRTRRAVLNHVEASLACPKEYPLIYDPQTAGGLLFFVSRDECDNFVNKLRHESAKSATVIGELSSNDEEIIDYTSRLPDDNVCVAGDRCSNTERRIKIIY